MLIDTEKFKKNMDVYLMILQNGGGAEKIVAFTALIEKMQSTVLLLEHRRDMAQKNVIQKLRTAVEQEQ